MDLISIIVPLYNVEKYIDRCIKSIIGQTYKNIEILLINDGSTDNSMEICNSFAIKDNRIKIFNQKNKGLSSARNTGLYNSSGSFVVFIDSDDYINKEMIESLYYNIKKYSSDISICGVEVINEEGKIKFIDKYREEKLSIDKLFNTVVLPLKTAVWNKMYRKSKIGSIRFFEGHVHGEDLYFILSILNKNSIVSTTAYVGYNYVKRENSITTKSFSENSFDEILFKDLSYYMVKEKFYKYKLDAEIWRFRARMNLIRKIYSSNSQNKYKEQLQDYNRYCLQIYNNLKEKLVLKEKFEYVLYKYTPLVYSYLIKIMKK